MLRINPMVPSQVGMGMFQRTPAEDSEIRVLGKDGSSQ